MLGCVALPKSTGWAYFTPEALYYCSNHFPCRFSFDSLVLDSIVKAQLAVLLFGELVNTSKFDKDKLLRFCLTLSRNYRPIPYHNWDHAFSVAHCMYYIIIGAPEMFTEIEVSSSVLSERKFSL